MAEQTEVVVVGAGFAGLTAARELSQRGHPTILLEARDRIGGRAWTDERLGRRLEMGATWIHWTQPHVWSEVTRYGIETTLSPTQTKAYWFEGGERREGTVEALFELLDEPLAKAVESTRDCFPFPYQQPVADERVEAVSNRSLSEQLGSLGLSQDQQDLAKVYLSAFGGARPELFAASGPPQWAALYGHTWQGHLEASALVKFKHGSGSLAAAMAADSEAELRLSIPVSRIERSEGEVRVTTESGGQIDAKAVVVTAPLNTVGQIEFDPPLSPDRQEVVEEGMPVEIVKVWARVRGKHETFFSLGTPDSVLNNAQLEYEIDGDGIVVAFGLDANRLDPTDAAAVQEALRIWIDDIEVIEATGHNWVADPYARGTWPVLRPGQLLGPWQRLREPDAGLFFAGSDYAPGALGYIDGAIESGLHAARGVGELLADAGRPVGSPS